MEKSPKFKLEPAIEFLGSLDVWIDDNDSNDATLEFVKNIMEVPNPSGRISYIDNDCRVQSKFVTLEEAKKMKEFYQKIEDKLNKLK